MADAKSIGVLVESGYETLVAVNALCEALRGDGSDGAPAGSGDARISELAFVLQKLVEGGMRDLDMAAHELRRQVEP